MMIWLRGYRSRSNGRPSAEISGRCTSLVIGADIPADRITVANPYGYLEEITVAEFLDRTSFEAFEDMPLFLRLGFAFGVFEKNMFFSVRKNAS